jgi:hypothetical protein
MMMPGIGAQPKTRYCHDIEKDIITGNITGNHQATLVVASPPRHELTQKTLAWCSVIRMID